MIKLDRTNKVVDGINEIVAKGIVSAQEKEFLGHWKTYLALALLDDLGGELAGEITSLIDTINCADGIEC